MKDHPINPDGPRLLALLVLDVNETLSDMSPLASRFEDVGAPAHLAQTWFAELRDGFALTVSGVAEPFARLGGEMLRVRIDGQDLDRDLDEAVQHVLGGCADLALHPDVAEGLNALANLGIRRQGLPPSSCSPNPTTVTCTVAKLHREHAHPRQKRAFIRGLQRTV